MLSPQDKEFWHKVDKWIVALHNDEFWFVKLDENRKMLWSKTTYLMNAENAVTYRYKIIMLSVY